MSTRCNIIIKGYQSESFNLYHHYDGYPSGVGALLQVLCEKMNNSYYHMEAEDIANMLIKHGISILDKETGKTEYDREYELTSCMHGDSEYLYILYARPYAKNGAKRYFTICYATDGINELRYYRKTAIPNLNDKYDVIFNQ